MAVSPARVRQAVSWRVMSIRTGAGNLRSLGTWRRDHRVPVQLTPGPLPVIFCTWRRLDRLPRTLDMLAAQDIPVQALIWNNSPDEETVDKAVASAPLPVMVYHSPRNIGGFGRFYLAREAAAAGFDRVVFIDDDQDFGPETVRVLAAHCPPKTLSGWWAFRLPRSDFWHQEQTAPGETASYVGTGGMAADTAVFLDPGLFRCPRRFWFVEDLWLCYFASHLAGYQLVKSPASFEMIEDGRNQFIALGWIKQRFMRLLLRRGWALPGVG
jgi:GT2 family glycosyltransferase